MLLHLLTGRRFAEAEFVTYLVMLVQKWTFHLKEGWTAERMLEAIESKASILTLMPRYAKSQEETLNIHGFIIREYSLSPALSILLPASASTIIISRCT